LECPGIDSNTSPFFTVSTVKGSRQDAREGYFEDSEHLNGHGFIGI
jgi:hypothetical protein